MGRARPRMERIEEVLEELRDLSSQGVPIVVEGPKDEVALRVLGVLGKVYKISAAGAALPMLAETLSVQADEAIILTDFDHKGDELAHELGRLLSLNGVTPQDRIRSRLRGLTRASHIEGLPRHLARLGAR